MQPSKLLAQITIGDVLKINIGGTSKGRTRRWASALLSWEEASVRSQSGSDSLSSSTTTKPYNFGVVVVIEVIIPNGLTGTRGSVLLEITSSIECLRESHSTISRFCTDWPKVD